MWAARTGLCSPIGIRREFSNAILHLFPDNFFASGVTEIENSSTEAEWLWERGQLFSRKLLLYSFSSQVIWWIPQQNLDFSIFDLMITKNFPPRWSYSACIPIPLPNFFQIHHGYYQKQIFKKMLLLTWNTLCSLIDCTLYNNSKTSSTE